MTYSLIPKAINAVLQDGSTVLHTAAERGNKEVCELLVSLMTPGAINAANKYGNTALHLAMLQGYSIVKAITDKDSKVLQLRMSEGANIVKLLIPSMIPETISAANKAGKTALHLA